MDVKAFLKTIPEFEQLPDADVDLMARLAKVGEAKAGAMVDVQGEPATKFYILVSGRLGVVLELDFGVTKKNYMVTSVGPGQELNNIVEFPWATASQGTATHSIYFLDGQYLMWNILPTVAPININQRLALKAGQLFQLDP